jgi:isopentenyl diphosphate isomerase/L-lactate dehydrogenase-like FMN-dependent dehydrogenase
MTWTTFRFIGRTTESDGEKRTHAGERVQSVLEERRAPRRRRRAETAGARDERTNEHIWDAWSNSHSSIPIAASYCAGTTNFGGAYSSPLALAAAAVSAYSRRMSS